MTLFAALYSLNVTDPRSFKRAPPANPSAVAITPDGKRALVVKSGANRVAVLDIDGQKVGCTKVEGKNYDIASGLNPLNVQVTPNGKLAIVANMGGGQDGQIDTVEVLDLEVRTPRVVDQVAVGDGPEGLAMSPAGGYAASVILNGTGGTPKTAFYKHDKSYVVLLKVEGKTVRKVAQADVGGLAEGAAFSAGTIIAAIVVALIGTVFAVVRRLGMTGVYRREGLSLSFIILALIGASLGAAELLSPLAIWQMLGPLLLFLGLLTLLNAPFDWFSLGLTRALLRRGLELGGWWPYVLALVDAGLAAVIIAALAVALVVGVQTFDALAVHGGGKPVLPLKALFDGITAQPSLPEYWWVYALLLSTMIPSLVNLVIGGASLVRGLPGLPSLLLRKVPAQGNVPKFDRAWIATVLTFQVAAGAAFGTAAQAVLIILIIGYVMPFFGLELLDMARDIAAFNLPARVGQLFGVSL